VPVTAATREKSRATKSGGSFVRAIGGAPVVVNKSEAPQVLPLARSLGYHIRELSESLTTAMDASAKPMGISLSQWRYLRELWEEDGLSSGELTRRVGRQGPTTVVAVQSMERAGLIRTVRSEQDRRISYVHLTPRGRKMAATMSPAVQQVYDMSVKGLSEAEILAFKKLLVRMQRNVDACTRSRTMWSVWGTDLLSGEVGE